MKKQFVTLIFLSIATTLANAQNIDFSAAEVSLAEGNTIILDGVRVDGFGLTRNDALRVKFNFNPAALAFELDANNVITYTDVGIFHEQHMVIDVEPVQLSYTANLEATTGRAEEEVVVLAGEPLMGGTDYNFNLTNENPFVATFELKKGHVFSWDNSRRSRDIEYDFSGPNIQVTGQLKSEDSSGLSKPMKILMDGIYELKIAIADPKFSKATFRLNAFNNNRTMSILADGQRINEILTRNTWDYLKFQVSMSPKEILEVPAYTTNADIAMKLVNQNSQVVAYADNKQALSYQEESGTGQDYYLFIYNKAGAGGRYSAKVSLGIEQPEEDKKPKPKPETEGEETTTNETITNTDEPAPDVNESEPAVDDEGQFEDDLQEEIDGNSSES